MKKRIILITGGQRSGKSSYAQQLALQQTAHPVYLATSRVWDNEHRQRIERHKEDRGPEWTNIEEDKNLSRHPLQGRVIVIDCVTLWATNFFYDNDGHVEKALSLIKDEFNRLTDQQACFIFVTNEIGMGGMSANELQRKFTDMQGWLNQYIASRADEVILMISGIPLKIKT
jgi:adenosylcobinamide kinase/adenosylcobinamide-phosphate guanylyltransferase